MIDSEFYPLPEATICEHPQCPEEDHHITMSVTTSDADIIAMFDRILKDLDDMEESAKQEEAKQSLQWPTLDFPIDDVLGQLFFKLPKLPKEESEPFFKNFAPATSGNASGDPKPLPLETYAQNLEDIENKKIVQAIIDNLDNNLNSMQETNIVLNTKADTTITQATGEDASEKSFMQRFQEKVAQNRAIANGTASLPQVSTGGIGNLNSTARGSGARFNAGKPDYSLIPLELLADECRVFEYGAKKYKAWNWLKGQNWSVPFASALRHLSAFQAGEENDPESGLPHLAHVAANIHMLTYYSKYFKEGDDRASKEHGALHCQ